MNRNLYLNNLRTLLDVHRKHGFEYRDMIRFLKTYFKPDLDDITSEIIVELRKLLRDYRVEPIYFHYFEPCLTKPGVWSCSVTFSFNKFMEGFGNTPSMAAKNLLEQMKLEVKYVKSSIQS